MYEEKLVFAILAGLLTDQMVSYLAMHELD